jgi:hypothetical protein
MSDEVCREGYTYEKFILYLYLCAAYADYEIEESEVDMIKEKMVKRGFLTEENFNKCWQEVLQDFKKHNDMESIDHIEGCVQDLKMDEANKRKIYKDLQEIMEVDGEEEESERVNLFRLKKMMGL